MTEEEYEQKYRKYLATINAGQTDQMNEFVADHAVFNGLEVNPKSYGEHIASFSDKCEEGLHFELVDIVIDAAKGRLASKLVVSGKPVSEFMGMVATGNAIRFNEVGSQ